MSELNGDKARFQRLRKAGLLRRDKAREAYAEMKRRVAAKAAMPADDPAGEPPEDDPTRSHTAKHEGAVEPSVPDLSAIAQTPGDTRHSI